MILAAGRSTRLGDLGERLPKPMLPLGQRPVLEWTIERLRASGISEVVINLHHAAHVIPGHFGDGDAWGVHITYVFEPNLLGTAGGVRNARHLLEDDTFLVVYGDTVLDWDPVPMVRDHRAHRPLATIVVAEVEDPSRLGVVSFDQHRRIRRFKEKPGPDRELGQWVNAGLYVFEPDIFEHLEHLATHAATDFGIEVFPALLERGLPLRAYPRPRPLVVIDTCEQLRRAQQAWVAPVGLAYRVGQLA
jgi:mannose-1-phosphate guanylyltransferase/phosphomannomutase